MKVSQLLKISPRRAKDGDSGSKRWGTPEQISFSNWVSNRKIYWIRTVLGWVEVEDFQPQPPQKRTLG